MKMGLIFVLITFLIIYSCIFASISFSPWFSWSRNALSDLGHCIRSKSAPIYNFGLAIGGLLLSIYSIIFLKNNTKITWIVMFITSIFLQLIGVYDEAYRSLHGLVSVSFFISMWISMVILSIEKGLKIGVITSIIYIIIWILYYNKIYSSGVSVPELLSSLTATLLIIFHEYRT